MKSPRISVIMPLWNRAHCVERSIRSVLDQADNEVEVVVWDDGSRDRGLERVKSMKDPRIVVGRSDQNEGVNRARNHAAALAKGVWLMMLDSDDRLEEGVLKALEAELDQLPEEVVLAFYGTRDDRSGEMKSWYAPGKGVVEYEDYLGEKVVRGEFLPVVRRSAFREQGGYPENVVAFERILWNRLAQTGKVWVNVTAVRRYGYEDQHRLTSEIFKPKHLARRIKSYQVFLEEFGAPLARINGKLAAHYWRVVGVHQAAAGELKSARDSFAKANRLKFNAAGIFLGALTRFGRWPFRAILRHMARG